MDHRPSYETFGTGRSPDWQRLMVAAIFEARMSSTQAQELAGLMQEGRATRPSGVCAALLLYEEGIARLIAVWADRERLDRYLAEAEVPRGTELMRKVGVEPTLRIVDALEFG